MATVSFSLPMRDGNGRTSYATRAQGLRFSLPMRDGNGHTEDEVRELMGF